MATILHSDAMIGHASASTAEAQRATERKPAWPSPRAPTRGPSRAARVPRTGLRRGPLLLTTAACAKRHHAGLRRRAASNGPLPFCQHTLRPGTCLHQKACCARRWPILWNFVNRCNLYRNLMCDGCLSSHHGCRLDWRARSRAPSSGLRGHMRRNNGIPRTIDRQCRRRRDHGDTKNGSYTTTLSTEMGAQMT